MTQALWRVAEPSGNARLALGDLRSPHRYMPAKLTIGDLLNEGGGGLLSLASLATNEKLEDYRILPPIDRQPVWAAGVTFERSREARLDESGGADIYARVYDADRPELFLKAIPGKSVGTTEEIRLRSDSNWNVPEPELVVIVNSRGEIVGCTLGNDLSSRSIEAENALYLPQAKIWSRSSALGPAIVPIGELPLLVELEISLTVERDGLPIYSERVPISAMKRQIPDLVSWLFRDQEFEDGVALMTGTSMVPPDDFTLNLGDVVTIESVHIGRLVNRVAP